MGETGEQEREDQQQKDVERTIGKSPGFENKCPSGSSWDSGLWGMDFHIQNIRHILVGHYPKARHMSDARNLQEDTVNRKVR